MTDPFLPRLRKMPSHATAAEYACAALRYMIVHGLLAAGQRIDQAEICRQLGVSRVPVNFALQRLEGEGLVTMVPHRGARVAALNRRELVEVSMLRGLLEQRAVQLAVRRLTEEDLERLAHENARMRRAAQARDWVTVVETARQFHFIICRASGQVITCQIIENLWDKIGRYLAAAVQLNEDPDMASNAHDKFIELVRAGRYDEAEQLMRWHNEAIDRSTVRWFFSDTGES